MSQRTGTPANRQNGADQEYAKGLKEGAKVGEVIQLVERGVAPVRAGVKFAIVLSVLSLLFSFAAVGWVLAR